MDALAPRIFRGAFLGLRECGGNWRPGHEYLPGSLWLIYGNADLQRFLFLRSGRYSCPGIRKIPPPELPEASEAVPVTHRLPGLLLVDVPCHLQAVQLLPHFLHLPPKQAGSTLQAVDRLRHAGTILPPEPQEASEAVPVIQHLPGPLLVDVPCHLQAVQSQRKTNSDK